MGSPIGNSGACVASGASGGASGGAGPGSAATGRDGGPALSATPPDAGRRAFVVGAMLGLAGCAGPPKQPFSAVVGTAALPIVLRLAGAAPSVNTPSGAAALGSQAYSGVMTGLGLAVPTLGLSLLLFPVAIASGLADASKLAGCEALWKGPDGQGIWLRDVLAGVDVSDLLTQALREALGKAQRVRVTRSTGASPAAERDRELESLGREEQASRLVLADLRFGLEGSPTTPCSPRLHVGAMLVLVDPERPAERLAWRYETVERDPADGRFMERAAADPSLLEGLVEGMLRELAARIARHLPQAGTG